MRVLSNTTSSTLHWAKHALEDPQTAVGQVIRKIQKIFKILWTKFQIRQMQSVLEALNSEQLDKMGIKRIGIREHAKQLITFKYDGL